jgi:hypothetical protein
MIFDELANAVTDTGHDTSLGTMENKRPYEIKIHIIISLILIKPRHKHEMSYIFLKLLSKK